jgi:hypothetical protein
MNQRELERIAEFEGRLLFHIIFMHQIYLPNAV